MKWTPADRRTSARLDRIVAELDQARPSPLHRLVLRLRKRWHERRVPAYRKDPAR